MHIGIHISGQTLVSHMIIKNMGSFGKSHSFMMSLETSSVPQTLVGIAKLRKEIFQYMGQLQMENGSSETRLYLIMGTKKVYFSVQHWLIPLSLFNTKSMMWLGK